MSQYIPNDIRRVIEESADDNAEAMQGYADVGDYLSACHGTFTVACSTDAVQDQELHLRLIVGMAAAAFSCLQRIGFVRRGVTEVLYVSPPSGLHPAATIWDVLEGEARYTEEEKIPECDADIASYHLGEVPRDPQTTGTYFSLIRRYLRQADEVYATTPGQRATLDVVRKVATLTARFLRDHTEVTAPAETSGAANAD